MSPKTNSSPDQRLRKAGIPHFDVLIHDQPKEWLIKNFSQGADKYPVNVARLMRNIIWQTRERIVAGIRNFRFHDLRHTFASYLAMAGVSIYIISNLLGHSSVRVTERYAHLSPKDTVAAVDLLQGHLAKANDTLMTLERKDGVKAKPQESKSL